MKRTPLESVYERVREGVRAHRSPERIAAAVLKGLDEPALRLLAKQHLVALQKIANIIARAVEGSPSA